MSHPREAAEAGRHAVPHSRRWWALVVLCLAEFMLILDVTAVNIALPSIGAEFSLSRSALTWVVTAYVVTFGGLMLLGGRLADVLGRRRMLVIGLVVFTLGSLACGLAPDEVVLIGGRLAQGVGAALVAPAALASITAVFTGAERDRALGVWASIGASGFVVGVILSGLLTSGPGWEWVFLINVPVGLVVLALLPRLVPADEARARGQRLDLGGAVLVTSSVALLIYGLTAAGDEGWIAAWTLVPLALSVVLGVLFVWLEHRLDQPLVRVEVFRRQPVVVGTMVMLAASGLLLALLFLAAQYLQRVRGYEALETGLTYLPVAVAVTLSANVAGRLIGKVGPRPVAVVAFALPALGAGLLSRIDGGSGVWTTVVPGLVLVALGLGPGFVVATTTALSYVDPHEAGLVSGVVNTGHELGGAIGVAVVSTLAAGSLGAVMADTDGYTSAFTVIAVGGAVAALGAWLLVPKDRPAHVHVGHGH